MICSKKKCLFWFFLFLYRRVPPLDRFWKNLSTRKFLKLANSRPTAGNYARYVRKDTVQNDINVSEGHLVMTYGGRTDKRSDTPPKKCVGRTFGRYGGRIDKRSDTPPKKITSHFFYCLDFLINFFLVLKPSIFFKDSIAIISFQIGPQIKK